MLQNPQEEELYNSVYRNWENTVFSAPNNLKSGCYGESTTETTVAATIATEYILPESDSRYISASELDLLTSYFSQFSWYVPTIEADSFQESMLNEYEIADRDLIVRYEVEHGYR